MNPGDLQMDWFCNSMLWSLIGLLIGIFLGYLLRGFVDSRKARHDHT